MEAEFDRLADVVRSNLDMDLIYSLVETLPKLPLPVTEAIDTLIPRHVTADIVHSDGDPRDHPRIGGVRSGKSRFAADLASRLAGDRPVLFVATARRGPSAGMEARIERHRANRPEHWQTVEAPLDLAEALREASGAGVVLVDCLTMWISNICTNAATATRRSSNRGRGQNWTGGSTTCWTRSAQPKFRLYWSPTKLVRASRRRPGSVSYSPISRAR